MKYLKLFFLLTLMTVCTVNASAKDDDYSSFKYELTRDDCPASRDADYVIFYVYSYGKKSSIKSDLGFRNAIHGILFKGLPETNKQGAIAPMLNGSYDKYKDYLDKFFSSGDYLQYVVETNKGYQDVVKIKGGEYKVGIIVKVNIGALRKRLQNDGILTDYYEEMM